MASIATTPQPGMPYTFTSAAECEAYLGAVALRRARPMYLEVLADPSWPGLRHADRMAGLLLLLKVTFLLIGVPIAIASAARAWVALAICIAIAALLPIVGLAWIWAMPTARVVFDWQAGTLTCPGHVALPLDTVRLDVARVPRGAAVYATDTRGQRCLVGLLRDDAVAAAYVARLTTLIRDRADAAPRGA